MEHFGTVHIFEAGPVFDLCFIWDKINLNHPRISYRYFGSPYTRELIPIVDSVTVGEPVPVREYELNRGSSFSYWQSFPDSDYGLICWSSARRKAGVVMPVWGFGELLDDKVMDIIRRVGC